MPPAKARAIIRRRNLWHKLRELVEKRRNIDDVPSITNETIEALIATLTPEPT
jgi:hypothetical protein